MALYFPSHLNIETSDYCNRSCSYCPVQRDRDASPPTLLPLELFERLLRELGDAPEAVADQLKISLQWIDEPLANPELYAYAELGKKLVPRAQWLLQTNGDFLTREHAERLSPLFDGVVVNFYSEKAKKSFEGRGVEVLLARRPDLIQHPGRLCPPAGEEGAAEALWHLNEKWHDEDWVQHHDEVQVPEELACHQLWVQSAVGYDGNVYICCRDNLKNHPVGNLREHSLFEAYNSPAAGLLRRRMEAGRRDRIAMCHTCPGEYRRPFPALTSQEVAPLLPHRLGDGPTTPLTALQARPTEDKDPEDEQIQPQGSPGAPTPVRRASLAIVEHPAPPSPRPAHFRPDRMPLGLYDYWTARTLARELGHVALPGFLPRRYEFVVGLTRPAAADLIAVLRESLGDALKALWVCGSRVMTRPHLHLVDPSVFECESPLIVGHKDRLRVFGNDVRISSDLDIKVLVDAAALDDDQARRLGRELGPRVEDLVSGVPVSGHRRPLLRVWRVPSSCEDARAAFAHYNGARLELMNKGPLSLEYTQLLFDAAAAESVIDLDPFAPVLGSLDLAPDAAPLLTLAEVDLRALPSDEGQTLRSEWHGLSVHQLVCALADFPEFEPPGVVVKQGRIVEGALAAWAALRAGRTHLRSAPLAGRVGHSELA